ncbi:MAG TPA: hypothetical protein VFV78_10650 [Vicinamibacterales bacterium]|nr:hypothetical protein [Vicinamibacterales bacterium]
MTLQHWLATSRGLGIAASVGLVLCALAMQDIAHGEQDVHLEFWAIRVGFVLIALFIAATFVTLRKVQRASQPA